MSTPSIPKIRAALQVATHKTAASWRGMKERIAALTEDELEQAMEWERMGKRRTEHLKLLDIEQRRRRGDVSPRSFNVKARA